MEKQKLYLDYPRKVVFKNSMKTLTEADIRTKFTTPALTNGDKWDLMTFAALRTTAAKLMEALAAEFTILLLTVISGRLERLNLIQMAELIMTGSMFDVRLATRGGDLNNRNKASLPPF